MLLLFKSIMGMPRTKLGKIKHIALLKGLIIEIARD